MSTAADHDAHHDPSHDDHDGAAHAHDFDGEPAKELPLDEPRTPGWIPLLGAALFLAAAMWMLVRSNESSASEGADADANAKAAETATATARPVAPPPPPQGVQPSPNQPRPLPPNAMPPPTRPTGSGAVQKMSPEDQKKLLDQLRARAGQKK